MELNKKFWLIIIIFTGIGALLRFYHLDYNSIWLDEAATITFTKLSLSDYWNLLNTLGEVHPPLFYLFEKLILPFGETEFLFRLIPAIFGTITIPVFYLIGKELVDEYVGITMAVLLTFSTFGVRYSQDARMYSMLLFFTSMSLLIYLKGLKRNNFYVWSLYGATSAVAIWTQFYSILFFCILNIYAIIFIKRERNTIIPLFTCFLLTAVICLPLLITVKNLFILRIGSGIPAYGFTGINLITKSISQIIAPNAESIILVVIILIIGIISLYIEKFRIFIFITICSFSMIIATLILSLIMPIEPRYLIPLLPLLFAVMGASYLPLRKRWNAITGSLVVIIILVIAFSVPLLAYYSSSVNPDWRNTAKIIDNISQPGDTVIILPDYNRLPFDYYYNNSTNGLIEYGSTNLSEVIKLRLIALTSNHSVYFIFSDDLHAADPSDNIHNWIINRSTLIGTQNFVYIWKSSN